MLFSLPCEESFQRIHHVVTDPIEGETSIKGTSDKAAVLVHLKSGFVLKTRRTAPPEAKDDAESASTCLDTKVFIDILFVTSETQAEGNISNKTSGEILLSQKTNIMNDKRGLPCLLYHVALPSLSSQSPEDVAEMVLKNKAISYEIN